MHHIEMGNEETTFEFIITEASRDTLQIEHEGERETVRTDHYVVFAQALTAAYKRLDGTARLQNESGRCILMIVFKRGQVSVEVTWGATTRKLKTDQSFIIETVRQIGILE